MRGAKIIVTDVFMSVDETERNMNIKKVIIGHLVKEFASIMSFAPKDPSQKPLVASAKSLQA